MSAKIDSEITRLSELRRNTEMVIRQLQEGINEQRTLLYKVDGALEILTVLAKSEKNTEGGEGAENGDKAVDLVDGLAAFVDDAAAVAVSPTSGT